MIKRVRFSDQIEVIFVDSRESRAGEWHLDGIRFRMRIREAEEMLAPILVPRGNDQKSGIGCPKPEQNLAINGRKLE